MTSDARPVLGDMNNDGLFDFFDIAAFELALTDPEQYVIDFGAPLWEQRGDINLDDVFDFFDIEAFEQLAVTGGGRLAGGAPQFGFTGREGDVETGLQYNRGRYYDGAVGRWISEDPMGFAGGQTNLSAYVDNGPTDRKDPSGLGWLSDFWEWLWDTGTSVAPGTTPVAPLEGTPDAAKIAIIRAKQKKAMDIEAKCGADSKQARVAWKEYEDAKKKLQNVGGIPKND